MPGSQMYLVHGDLPDSARTVLVLSRPPSLCLLGLVHVGDELREVNGITVLHKRPDEISQILVCIAYLQGGRSSETKSRGLPRARADLPLLPSLCEDGASKMVSSSPASLSLLFSSACVSSSFTYAPWEPFRVLGLSWSS